MGCVHNVFEHQQYLISCTQSVLNELRKYPLKKVHREMVSACLAGLYDVAVIYRTEKTKKQLDRLVNQISTPRVGSCEDDLPF